MKQPLYRVEGLSVYKSENGLSRHVASTHDESAARWLSDILNSEAGHLSITVAVRNVYGNDLVYPEDSAAILFAALLGVKSFNQHQISAIRALGYSVNVAAGQLPRKFQPREKLDSDGTFTEDDQGNWRPVQRPEMLYGQIPGSKPWHGGA